MLRTLIAEADVGDVSPQTIGGMPSGDLFALANAIAALLDSPVTIEDRGFNVLAFSGRQDEADSSRVETILGRQVPDRFASLLTASGVVAELYRNEDPIYVSPGSWSPVSDALPRAALAVRAGDEILGSIWAAVREPLNAARTEAFVEAGKLVALHLLRIRAGADVERGLRSELISSALEGGTAGPEALGRLGLLGKPLVAMAMGLAEHPGGGDDSTTHARRAAEKQRLADAFAMHLGATQPRAVAALIGDTVYGLVPAHDDAPRAQERMVSVAEDFLARTGTKVPAVIGIGSVAHDATGLNRSKTGADRALRVLLHRGESGTVAAIDRVHVEALLLELGDLAAARGDQLSGPIARLRDYDAEHKSQLLITLECWLMAFGDVTEAAAAAFVHTNTFRYRLKRVAEVGRIDLSDASDRFEAMLQLRLLRSSRNVSASADLG
ncbi:PucR family transcriptional regulator [Microbacterium sp. NIBRBAC000506063]|uniref:PucR family transcriptional regulator n=1 Tax=Microbacterium sp. NIBRBAC000506063 TaxID=2734618 RepID=UPI001BB6F2B4|nr:PucR family transcriptional regulator [Microbacterium sp. NIBRBAC000506063]QTV79601.1 helix-turn-helix domain-containing protein [Microbacterium sp. NIBRBAC000506063]